MTFHRHAAERIFAMSALTHAAEGLVREDKSARHDW